MIVGGLDLASKSDYSALCTVEIKDDCLEVTGVYRFQGEWKQQLPTITNLINYTNRVVVDGTGIGNPVTEVLQSMTTTAIEPFTFTASSKPKLIEMLLGAVHRGYLRVSPSAPGADVLKQEMLNFKQITGRKGFKYTGKGRGRKDDTVMACALAVYAAMMEMEKIKSSISN